MKTTSVAVAGVALLGLLAVGCGSVSADTPDASGGAGSMAAQTGVGGASAGAGDAGSSGGVSTLVDASGAAGVSAGSAGVSGEAGTGSAGAGGSVGNDAGAGTGGAGTTETGAAGDGGPSTPWCEVARPASTPPICDQMYVQAGPGEAYIHVASCMKQTSAVVAPYGVTLACAVCRNGNPSKSSQTPALFTGCTAGTGTIQEPGGCTPPAYLCVAACSECP